MSSHKSGLAMKLDFIGDIHGDHHTLRAWSQITKADTVIQVGDFGVMPKAGYPLDPYSPYHKPTLFIPGNHDDHQWLRRVNRAELPPKLEYLGRVGEISLGPWSIAYLGGGYSIDRHMRTEGIDWWRDEEPFKWELDKFASYTPDIAVTHEGPSSVVSTMKGRGISNSTAKMLDNLISNVPEFRPKLWVFGHHHPLRIETLERKGIKFVCLPIFTGRKEQVYSVEEG